MPGNDVGLRSERGPVLAAVMLTIALVAIDATILATAVPSIIEDVGGFTEFPWLFSVYLLAQAVSVPIYGKINDLFGRKPVILGGIGLFLLGSIMCGLAWSIWPLIAFRVVQGLGAGAIMPTTITMIGDLYSVRERAKVQGYVASVWGVASVVGPALGGVFSEYASWRWIFLINIPLCLLAGAMIWRGFTERVDRGHPAIDYRGAVLLTFGLSLVILGVLEGGQAWAWDSPAGLTVLGTGLLTLIVFGLVERRAPEPVLPLWVFRRRLLITSGVLSAAAGAILLGLSSYVPTYVQAVLGTGPLVAGFALASLMLGWPIAASQAGRVYLRVGFRACAVIGAVLVCVGTGLLLLLDERSAVLEVAAFCLVIGLGMGLTTAPTMIAAQSSVGWAERGVVTANNIFLRSLGSALGVAVFGAIANAVVGGDDVDPARLTVAVHRIFLALALLGLVMLLMATLLPRSADAPLHEAAAAPLHEAAAATGDETVAATGNETSNETSGIQQPGPDPAAEDAAPRPARR